jgi:hypothetical protein
MNDMEGAAEFPDGASVEVQEIPIEQKLKYKSKEHNKLLARLTSLRDLAEQPIKNQHDEWNRVDEHAGMYVDITRSAIRGDGSVKTSEKEIPFERSFVVPVYFAVESVMMAQIMSVYQARDPMFQYDGHSGEDVAGAKLIEATAAYDNRVNKLNLQLYQLFKNALRYNVAPVHSFWNEDFGWTMQPIIQGPMAPLVGAMFPDLMRPVRQWGLRSSFVRHQPVDPYKLRVDPRKSISEYQDGDMIGHQRVESLMYFKERRKETGDGPYFNVDDLNKAGFDKSTGTGRSYAQGTEIGQNEKGDDDCRTYTVEHLEVRLIPKEWNLGESDRPEIWWFEWVGDAVIVRAHASAYDHGQFNYSIGSAIPDLHLVTSHGFGQLIEPLQRFMNWMGSSHLENVRRFVNNAGIIMERFVEIEDILNPAPGGHIRATQEAQELVALGVVGNPGVFYPQLALHDVTGGHLTEIQQMFDWVSRLTGANDPAQGIHLPSKRTATEIEKLSGASSQRASMTAELLDALLVQPMAEQHAMIRQQFTTDEQWFRVNGDLARAIEMHVGSPDMIQPASGGGIRVKIAPHDLYGQYDYVPYTGLDPSNPARSVEALMQLLQMGSSIPIISNPMMAAQMGEDEILDQKEVFTRLFENMKIKDVSRMFKPNPLMQVQPMDMIQQQVQAGNMVPAGQVGG